MVDKLFRFHDIGVARHALERGVMAFLGIGADAIARDHHQVAAIVSIAYGCFDAAIGGAADHDDGDRAAVVHDGIELVADEYRWPSLVDDEVVISGNERRHNLPAKTSF